MIMQIVFQIFQGHFCTRSSGQVIQLAFGLQIDVPRYLITQLFQGKRRVAVLAEGGEFTQV